MTDKRKDCPMRHENGNCTVAGGFCTAVNNPICEALHNAFDCGYRSALRQQEHFRDFTKKVETLTNAQKIRAMSDEELAKLLCCTGWRMFEQKECLEWLQQPSGADGNA